MQCSVLQSIPVIFDVAIQSPLPDIHISAYPCCTLSFDSVIRLALRCTTELSNIKPVNSRRCHILCFIHYAHLHYIVDSLNFNKSSLEEEPSLSLLGICSVWFVCFFSQFLGKTYYFENVLTCEGIGLHLSFNILKCHVFSFLKANRGSQFHQVPNKEEAPISQISHRCKPVVCTWIQYRHTNHFSAYISDCKNRNGTFSLSQSTAVLQKHQPPSQSPPILNSSKQSRETGSSREEEI